MEEKPTSRRVSVWIAIILTPILITCVASLCAVSRVMEAIEAGIGTKTTSVSSFSAVFIAAALLGLVAIGAVLVIRWYRQRRARIAEQASHQFGHLPAVR